MEKTFLDKINEKIIMCEGNIIGCLYSAPELYAEYNINKHSLSSDGLFYYGLGEMLFQSKNEVFDETAIYGILKNNDELKDLWEERGGFNTIRELKSTINLKNIDAYFDTFNKYCLLRNYYKKGFTGIIENEWLKFEKMNSSQVYDYFDYILNSEDIDTVSDLKFENLYLTDDELDDIMQGANMGLQFGQYSPILNYLTMGLPKGELSSICSYINEGKTSLMFANFVIPIVNNGGKCLLISNEQQSVNFKLLLLIYVLTRKLNYWKIDRKKLKKGKYSEDEIEMINKARDIVKNEFLTNITFVKTYDYKTDIVKKSIRKYSRLGYDLIVYDTMKVEDASDSTWVQLLEDSKILFQACSKYNVAGLVTLQLAMATRNKVRKISMECVANGKQVFEVMSEAIFMRTLWDDEFDATSKFYCKPYVLAKDGNGKFTNIHQQIDLEEGKEYKVVILGKTRNDKRDTALLYEVDSRYNIWKEIGYIKVHENNRY